MLSVENNVFSYKNAISKNTWEKPSYLPNVGYKYIGWIILFNVYDKKQKIKKYWLTYFNWF